VTFICVLCILRTRISPSICDFTHCSSLFYTLDVRSRMPTRDADAAAWDKEYGPLSGNVDGEMDEGELLDTLEFDAPQGEIPARSHKRVQVYFHPTQAVRHAYEVVCQLSVRQGGLWTVAGERVKVSTRTHILYLALHTFSLLFSSLPSLTNTHLFPLPCRCTTCGISSSLATTMQTQ
jgi:hypothetical protein